MEFDREKYTMLVMKSGKRSITEGVELPNPVVIRTLGEKENYKYLGILEADIVKQQEMKEKNKRSILEEPENNSRQNYSRNFAKEINTSAVSFVRYSEPFLKWTRELKQMDQRTRKLMTMHKALHPRDNVDILYVSRRERRRGLAGIEDSVVTSIQRFEDYIKKHGERLITATRNKTNDSRTSRTTITRKQK